MSSFGSAALPQNQPPPLPRTNLGFELFHGFQCEAIDRENDQRLIGEGLWFHGRRPKHRPVDKEPEDSRASQTWKTANSFGPAVPLATHPNPPPPATQDAASSPTPPAAEISR